MNPTLFTQNIAEVKTTYSHKVKASERPLVTSSKSAYDIAVAIFPDIDYREYFYALFLDRSNRLIAASQISMGGTAGTVADPKIIFQTALKSNAASIILAHNHPSGNLKPSEADSRLTKKLYDAGRLLDMPVLDHIIISSDSYLSFADDGLLN